MGTTLLTVSTMNSLPACSSSSRSKAPGKEMKGISQANTAVSSAPLCASASASDHLSAASLLILESSSVWKTFPPAGVAAASLVGST